ncbi:MAG: Methyltransferase type 11 [Aeromicrobium sp.]|nr:Methyltransferase type 11 [Aeromicrobium sp.]
MFEVAAESYGRFMGRFSEPLAAVFADEVDLRPGQRVLDVGCGPGALIAQLVPRVGAATVSAVDPSAPFVEAAKHRFPDVDIRLASAEELPYSDDTFDACLAALVVHFMSDPVAGLREMGRVTRPGGAIAACVWDYAGGASPLSTFWQAVTDLDPSAVTESELAGAREGHLVELCQAAGLRDLVGGYLTVHVPMASFEDWWEPFTLGVGPAGVHVKGLDAEGREALRDRCRELLPKAPFAVSASAWSVTASV